jgi:putative sterol carrier protein
VTEIEESLAGVVDRFNRHSEKNPALRTELAGLVRTIRIDLSDAGNYAVDLRSGHLENLRSNGTGPADLTIRTDRATFLGLIAKEIGPMKALVTRKLQIDGSLEDKLLFRKLL